MNSGFGFDLEQAPPPYLPLSDTGLRRDKLLGTWIEPTSYRIAAAATLAGVLSSPFASPWKVTSESIYQLLFAPCCSCGERLPLDASSSTMSWAWSRDTLDTVAHWLWMISPVVLSVMLLVPPRGRCVIVGGALAWACGVAIGMIGIGAELATQMVVPSCCTSSPCVSRTQKLGQIVLVVLGLVLLATALYLSSRASRRALGELVAYIVMSYDTLPLLESDLAETRAELAANLRSVLPFGPSLSELHAAVNREEEPMQASATVESKPPEGSAAEHAHVPAALTVPPLLNQPAAQASPPSPTPAPSPPTRTSSPLLVSSSSQWSRSATRASAASPVTAVERTLEPATVVKVGAAEQNEAPWWRKAMGTAGRASPPSVTIEKPTEMKVEKVLCDSGSQTIWRRPLDTGVAQPTESSVLRHDATLERFDLVERLTPPSTPPMSTYVRLEATQAVGVQTLLSGPSPYSGRNPPSSWRPPVKRTHDVGCQYHRPKPTKLPSPPDGDKQPRTKDVGVQSFLPALKPSKPSKPNTKSIGCGPGPWQWTSGGGTSEPPSPVSTPSWHRSPASTRSPRLPRVTLVFYNARTSYSSAPTPRRVTHSASLGQASVDAIEPTSFYAPLPGTVEFYVRLRTVDAPPLTGPGWRTPLQSAQGYASKRSIIWPTAGLNFDKVVGRETEQHFSRLLELEVVVPGSYTHGGTTLNPTLETATHNINLEATRPRHTHDDGTMRINIPLKTLPRQGLEQFVSQLRPKPPPAALPAPPPAEQSPVQKSPAPLALPAPSPAPPTVESKVESDAVARATRIWKQLDANRDGYVDRDELMHHLKVTVQLGEEMAQRVFNALDFDANGKIELDEWLRVYAGQNLSREAATPVPEPPVQLPLLPLPPPPPTMVMVRLACNPGETDLRVMIVPTGGAAP